MQGNKGNRFYLDLTFIGWFIAAFFVWSLVIGLILDAVVIPDNTSTYFVNMLVMGISGAVIFAPLYAYRGVTAAEYYHRAVCIDPRNFKAPPSLPNA